MITAYKEAFGFASVSARWIGGRAWPLSPSSWRAAFDGEPLFSGRLARSTNGTDANGTGVNGPEP